MNKQKAIDQLKIDILNIQACKLLNSIHDQMGEYESIINKIGVLNGKTVKKTVDKTSWDGLLDDSEHVAIANRMNAARSKLEN